MQRVGAGSASGLCAGALICAALGLAGCSGEIDSDSLPSVAPGGCLSGSSAGCPTDGGSSSGRSSASGGAMTPVDTPPTPVPGGFDASTPAAHDAAAADAGAVAPGPTPDMDAAAAAPDAGGSTEPGDAGADSAAPDAAEDPCPEGTTCDDGLYCTLDDRCQSGECTGVERACDDGRACTQDSCSESARSCVSDTSVCECSGAADCDDQNPCTTDGCQNDVCTHANNSAACDDGDACTTGEVCTGGSCDGSPRVCNANAGNPCIRDSCDSAVGCVTSNTTAACNDGNACTTGDACSGGSCRAGSARVCNANAGNPCIRDSCDPAVGCVASNTTAACDDGRACTSNDVCAGGVCSGVPGSGTGCGPTRLPTNREPCPPLVEGTLQFLGNDVELLAVGAGGGPIIFYWHGTGSSPLEAQFAGLGTTVINQVRSAGGMVVAMIGDQGSGQNTSGNGVWHDSDMVVADEVLACAIQQLDIDTSHIHSAGMSAGGLQTTSFSYMRSNYIASVAVYSGGVIFGNPTHQDPANKFAAMIVHGGVDDVVGISFMDASESYRDDLRGDGHFAFICDHGGGHTIPSGIGTHAWRFFRDHAYGTQPSPYASALPASFPTYCSL